MLGLPKMPKMPKKGEKMSGITIEKIISITILAEDEERRCFSQSLEGEDAEKWIGEVERRLEDISLVERRGNFPNFNWRYDYGYPRVDVDREPEATEDQPKTDFNSEPE